MVVVNITKMQVFSYFKDGENETEHLNQAVDSNKKDIATWEGHLQKYPGNEYFEGYLQAAKEAEYRVMTEEEFRRKERAFYINSPLKTISEERYNEMLNILPPLHWTNIRGVEMFCISEMLTGSYTDQFAKVGDDKFYAKTVDVKDKSTWIHNFL